MKNIKMKSMLLVLMVLLALGSGCSTNDQTATVFLDPATNDLGEISVEQKKNISFNIVNNTNENRSISSQAKSCGCTTLKLDSKNLKAHGRIKVRLQFDPQNESGRFEKSAFFRLDNGEILVYKFRGIALNQTR